MASDSTYWLAALEEIPDEPDTGKVASVLQMVPGISLGRDE